VKLHLVRHPQPAVAPGLCYGATDVDVVQEELDRVHAMLNGSRLPACLPVHTSPLKRCVRLARRLAGENLRMDARLAEMDFGAWEMRAWSVIPRQEVDAWAADLLHYRPGGAESVLDVARRVAGFVDALRKDAVDEALVICHAGTIRLLSSMRPGRTLEQAALEAAATPHRIGYGDILTLEI